MPTYEYVCDACGHSFEKFQSITAPSVRKCPECAKLKVRRLIGKGAGVIFRGSGFYQTDYRNADYQKSATAEKSSAKAKTSSGDTSKKAAGDTSKKSTAGEKSSAKSSPKSSDKAAG